MSIIDAKFRTITCNGCDKTVTYEDPKGLQEALDANSWMRQGRLTQTGDGRTFYHCSDACQRIALDAGEFNFQEAPQVVEVKSGNLGASAQVQAAIAAARQKEALNKATKQGSPIIIK